MTTKTEQEQEQNDSDSMEAGFNAVRGGSGSSSDDYESPDGQEDEPEVEKEQEPETDSEEVDEPVFAGLTEKELKSILERATRVDSLEEQIRKANGKIGELHGTLKEIQSRKPTQSAPAETDESDLSEFEATFPEFGPAVDARARKIAQELFQAQQAQGYAPDPEEISKQVNLSIMDMSHDGWRETQKTDDFKLWMASQPQDVQQMYQTTWNAKELGGIFTAYKSRQQATNIRSMKSKQRLENALTPDSRTQKVTHAITEQDAMQAGFDSVRNPRFYAR